LTDQPTIIYLGNQTTPPPAAPAPHTFPWILAILGIAFVASYVALLLYRHRHRNDPEPTRATLDAKDTDQRGAKTGLVAFLALAGYGTYWWATNGWTAMTGTMRALETFHLWWTLILSPTEQTLLLWLFLAAAIALCALAWMLHRLAWRAFFPDLLRLDPADHGGGKPELVGRLYKQRAWTEERVTPATDGMPETRERLPSSASTPSTSPPRRAPTAWAWWSSAWAASSATSKARSASAAASTRTTSAVKPSSTSSASARSARTRYAR
jgi:hypothetical protein